MNNTLAIVGDPHIQFSNPSCRQDNYFEAITDKLKQVLRENQYTVLLGDLFSLPVLDIQGLMVVISILQNYKNKGGKLYSLIGNHDIYSWQINTISKTTLGLLAKLDLVTILDADLDWAKKSTTIGDFKILPLSLNFNKKEIPSTDIKHSILVGHAFYASERDTKHSLSYEDIKELGYEYIFLGHDHSPFDPKIIENTVLYRPGSLGRTTSHTYNLSRKPAYYQIDLDTNEVEQVYLECKSRDEIFTYEVIEAKENKVPDYIYDIESLMQHFRQRPSEMLSVRKLLEDNEEVTEEIIEFIADAHEACGLEFV